jgi:hypothetical protein
MKFAAPAEMLIILIPRRYTRVYIRPIIIEVY